MNSGNNITTTERLERIKFEREKWLEETRNNRLQNTYKITWKHGRKGNEDYFELSGESPVDNEIEDRETNWNTTLHRLLTPPHENTWIYFLGVTSSGISVSNLVLSLWKIEAARLPSVAVLLLACFWSVTVYFEAQRLIPSSRLLIILSSFIGGIGLGILFNLQG